MIASLDYDGMVYFGEKLLTLFPNNTTLGKDSHQAMIILFEGKFGDPISMFDASYITELRTAAVSALATKYLARDDPNGLVLSIVGAGPQARSHIEAIVLVRKVKRIYIYNRTLHKAQKLGTEIDQLYNIPLIVSDDLELVVTNADILCTVTGSPDPIIKAEWVKEGTHINAVGASKSTTRELESELVQKSKFYGDLKHSTLNESGDFLIPLKEGLISEDHYISDLSFLVHKGQVERKNDNDITVFKNLGLAAEDVACAIYLHKTLNQNNK